MMVLSFARAADGYADALGSRPWACFDVFDTLLRRRADPSAPVRAAVRAVAERAGIADRAAVERERWDAYAELCAAAVAAGDDPETRLDRLAAAWTARLGHPGLADLAEAAELAADEALCFANPVLLTLCRRLREQGKRIAAVSDMYIGGAAVTRLLEANGFGGLVDRVFVSGDVGLQKRSGRLFGHVLDELGIGPQDTVHMGDDPVADWRRPRALGVPAWLVVDRGEVLRRARGSAVETEARRGRQAAFLDHLLREDDTPPAVALLAVARAAAVCGGQAGGRHAPTLAAALTALGQAADTPTLELEAVLAELAPAARPAAARALDAAPAAGDAEAARRVAAAYAVARAQYGVGPDILAEVVAARLAGRPVAGRWVRGLRTAARAGGLALKGLRG